MPSAVLLPYFGELLDCQIAIIVVAIDDNRKTAVSLVLGTLVLCLRQLNLSSMLIFPKTTLQKTRKALGERRPLLSILTRHTRMPH